MGLMAKICGLPGVMRGLHENELAPDPFEQFGRWFQFAKRSRIFLPNAIALATVGTEGKPSVRMMLLKGANPNGFFFYTNYESRKGGELAQNRNAAMVVHWNELQRQVRAEGVVERLSPEESAKYFHSRLRGSQVGAWSSAQSRVISSREELHRHYVETEKKYSGVEVPLPPFWGGFRLIPERVEFWQGRAFRLHDRLVYVRNGDAWRVERLSP
jgi:pyridoxamine 5'-phosphate oxidase